LFDALLIPFSNEDKRLTQHWAMHNLFWRIRRPVVFTTENMHNYVPPADILSTWYKLICVGKQRNSIPREHLR